MESHPALAELPSQTKHRRTLALVFLIYSVLFGGGMFLIAGMVGGYSGSVMPAIVTAVLAGIFFGVSMTWFTAQMWRRSGGPDTATLMQRAIKSRQLPPDIDIAEWKRLLAKKESEALRGQWLYPVFFGVLTCLYILAGVTNVFPRLGPLTWIGVILFAGFGIYAPFDTARRIRGIRALKSDLATSMPQEPPRPV